MRPWRFLSLSCGAFFRNVQNFVLEDEQVWFAFAGKTDHIFVVVFDPALHHFAAHQLHGNRFLLLAEKLQVQGFFESLLWWRRLRLLGAAVITRIAKSHADILTDVNHFRTDLRSCSGIWGGGGRCLEAIGRGVVPGAMPRHRRAILDFSLNL